MFVPKHINGAILLTMCSAVLVVSSVSLPWYAVSDLDSEGEPYHTRDYYLTDWGERETETGDLMVVTTVLVFTWAALSIVYVWRLLKSKDGVIRWWEGGFAMGTVLMAVGILTVILFANAVDGAYNADLDRYDIDGAIAGFAGSESYQEWGPAIGWYIAGLASLLVAAGVLLRHWADLTYRALGPEDRGM